MYILGDVVERLNKAQERHDTATLYLCASNVIFILIILTFLNNSHKKKPAPFRHICRPSITPIPCPISFVVAQIRDL